MSMQDNFLTIIFKKTGRISSFNITTGRFIISSVIIFLLSGILVSFIFQYGNISYKEKVLVKKVSGMEEELG